MWSIYSLSIYHPDSSNQMAGTVIPSVVVWKVDMCSPPSTACQPNVLC